MANGGPPHRTRGDSARLGRAPERGSGRIQKEAENRFIGFLHSKVGAVSMTVAGFLPGIWQAISLLGAVGSMVKSSEEREDEAVDESIRRGLQQAFHTACQRSASPIVIVRNAGGPDQHQVTYELVHHHTGTVRYVIADPLAQPRAALVQAESAAREAEANSKTLKARVAQWRFVLSRPENRQVVVDVPV